MKKLFEIATAVMVIGLAVVGGLGMLFLDTEKTIDNAARKDLFAEVRKELKGHFIREGRFPETLKDLPLTFEGDSTPDTLLNFTYTTDGQSYDLSCPLHRGPPLIDRFPPE